MTIEIIDHTGGTPKIENFSKDRFVDPNYVDREWASLWRSNWLVAGLVSDVADAGDYFVLDMAREQILVTRTSAGEVQGFFNVCQHRGNRLMTSERGRVANFRCAYHAWTYSIDGDLTAVPYKERFSDGVPCERALKKVRTDTWNGIVFINMDDKAEPLLAFLGSVVEHLAPYRFDQMTLVEDQTVHLECNWKAVVDNFSELYHVDFLHPQHRRMVDCCNDTVHLFPHGHTGLAVPGATFNPRFPVPEEPTDIHRAQLLQLGLNPDEFVGRVPEIRRAVQLQRRGTGQDKGFDYDAFNDEQLSDVWQYNLFPNVILSFTPGHCWLMRVRPHAKDPAKCEFDKLSMVLFADPSIATGAANQDRTNRDDDRESKRLQRTHIGMDGAKPADYVRPARDDFSYSEVIAGNKTMTDTIDQDVELLGNVQAGMSSSAFQSTWLNDDEMRVQHFHNEIDRHLNG
ncbi:MAG: aromatic ring-hydroxylating dioxygenase subunit alpha [Pseudomonadales bacterium]|nr:aromatic ring-hydroxylating dioxygenase subunit alpha [Pseudomonadales bacterium]